MKKKLYHASIFMLLLAFVASCVKDRGNYDLQDIPEFNASGFAVKVNGEVVSVLAENKVVISANDELSIVVNGELTVGFDPAYAWMLYEVNPILKPGSDFEAAVQIADTKDFNQKFSKGPGQYKLYYVVTNKQNNARYYEEFMIEVESLNGLLVYFKNGEGNGDYSAVRTAEMGLGLPTEKLGVIENVFSGINKEIKIENPTHLWLRQVGNGSSDNLIFAANKNDMIALSYRTHAVENTDYNRFFAFPLETSPLPQAHMNGSNAAEFLIQNQEVYKIDYMSGGSTPKYSLLNATGMQYAPLMMTIPTDMIAERGFTDVFYNKSWKRFEYDYFGLTPFMAAPGILGPDDVDISNTGMDLVYMAKGTDFGINAIMKDAQNNLRFVRFDITDIYASLCTHNVDLSTVSDVTEQSLWAASERAPVAFYTAGNKINLFHYTTGAVEAALSLPARAEIAVIKILKDQENSVYDNALLFIGYNIGGKGTFLQVEFNALSGKIKENSKQSYAGFGEIVDIALKK